VVFSRLLSFALPDPELLQGHVDHGHHFQTIRTFFKDQQSAGFSMLALRVKASAIFERANQLSTSWDPRKIPFQSLDRFFRAHCSRSFQASPHPLGSETMCKI
jgi:hypothetical protein